MDKLTGLFLLLIYGSACAVTAGAGETGITGRVVITKVLTKKRVTLPSYDLRGVTVSSENTDRPPDSNPTIDEISRVVIYLEGPGLKPATPTQGTLTQRNRHFEPEIVVIPVGSSVSFPNDDRIFHNVFSLSRVKPFDLGYYAAGEARTVRFDRPGVVQVYCHIHPDMSAAIVVLSTGFWTRPAPDGHYSLFGLPPGAYELVAWHRSAGFFRRQFTVRQGTTSSEDFVIPVKEKDTDAAAKPGSAQ